WANVCPATGWALPVASVFDSTGFRYDSSAAFTFSCLDGVIAKCYRWGYKPWKSQSLKDAHWACTRLARADYCTEGRPHTVTGTLVNVWDSLSPQVQAYGTSAGMYFE